MSTMILIQYYTHITINTDTAVAIARKQADYTIMLQSVYDGEFIMTFPAT